MTKQMNPIFVFQLKEKNKKLKEKVPKLEELNEQLQLQVLSSNQCETKNVNVPGAQKADDRLLRTLKKRFHTTLSDDMVSLVDIPLCLYFQYSFPPKLINWFIAG